MPHPVAQKQGSASHNVRYAALSAFIRKKARFGPQNELVDSLFPMDLVQWDSASLKKATNMSMSVYAHRFSWKLLPMNSI